MNSNNASLTIELAYLDRNIAKTESLQFTGINGNSISIDHIYRGNRDTRAHKQLHTYNIERFENYIFHQNLKPIQPHST